MDIILTVRQAKFGALVRALQLYMEQDECVCTPGRLLPFHQGEEPCTPECEQCMYCIARKAVRGVGAFPDTMQELIHAVLEAEDWLSEFCDDPTDEGAQNLLSVLRNILKQVDTRVYL